MTVYNVNLGIGWASSGVEYAQAYRSQSLKKLGIPAKFIFSDLILGNNIQDLTSNLDFSDDQIIWLYNFFTDVRIAPSTYPLSQLEKDLHLTQRQAEKREQTGNEVQYVLNAEGLVIVARLHDRDQQTIDQVSYVFNGQMVKRDFYSYVKYACEYYNGQNDNNRVTVREFYNEDGSVAYVQHLDGDKETFEMADGAIFYSKNALYREMIKRLNFQQGDIVILDRMNEDKQLVNGQIIFEEHRPAKLVVVVHADHYDKHYTNNQTVLWNNFYEYQFTHPEDVDSFVVATDAQKQLFAKQEKHFQHATPRIDTIPVGNLPRLTRPTAARKPHSMITASRLAKEKHVDWLVKATVAARQQVPDISLDIYGQGSESDRLQQLIKANHAEDFIRLMGQQDLSDVYVKYAAYVAASTSEGFGLSLLEAVGSGLPMIGFDVPYGNQTFIDDGQNGYRLPYEEEWTDERKVAALRDAMVKLFTEADLAAYSQHSYALAESYLTDNVAQLWGKVLEELADD